MKRSALLLVTALAVAAPLSAQAFPIPGLNNLIPGAQPVPGASVDADRFLQDALETSKYVMVAAALLAQAAEDKEQMASRASYIAAVQNAHDCKELEAHSAQFKQDMAAISANEQSTAKIQAAYDQADAEKKQLISAATYNLMLGSWRTVRLFGEGGQLAKTIGANPLMMMTKAPQLVAATRLVGMEAQAIGSVLGSMQRLSTAMKVEAPVQAETTKPKPVALS